MSTQTLTLFLDFDGVLHPAVDEEAGTIYKGPEFVFAPRLEETLRPWLPQIDLVISSTWGRNRSLDELKALLPPELSDRVIDAVHQHLPPLSRMDARKDLYSRYREIIWYITHVRPDIKDRWLAIDDDDWHWPDEERHHLAWCPNGLGTSEAQKALRDGLSQLGFTSPVSK